MPLFAAALFGPVGCDAPPDEQGGGSRVWWGGRGALVHDVGPVDAASRVDAAGPLDGSPAAVEPARDGALDPGAPLVEGDRGATPRDGGPHDGGPRGGEVVDGRVGDATSVAVLRGPSPPAGTLPQLPSGLAPSRGHPLGSVSVPRCPAPLRELAAPVAVRGPKPGSLERLSHAPEIADALEGSLRAARDGSLGAARLLASDALYLLCRLTAATEGPELVWYPEITGLGRPLLAWRPDDVANLVVEVPHPYFEAGTRQQGLLAFEEFGAHAVIISGTHRCASREHVACDGVTRVCGVDEPYRESDPAHNPESLFHLVHRVLADDPETVFVSLHGMAWPGLSVSDGTTQPVSEGDLVARVARGLAIALPGEPVTTCNRHAGAYAVNRLCGTTNIQGRHLNASPDICHQSALVGSGRFIHLEQAGSVRAAPRRRAVVAVLIRELN